jgi:3-phosphoshikimate 1-carboxyvinyltransferase
MVPLAIDEFPILFIAAAAAKGQTLLHGARELRYKESDRIFAMASGLQALGIEAQAAKDGIFIQGGTFQGGTVESFHDHRVAMAFSIAGAVSQKPVTIRDCQWIETSYPDFLSTALSVRLSIEAFHDNE